MIKNIAFLIIFLLPVITQAQYLSIGGRFLVVEQKGCASLTVNIQDTNLKPAEAICGPGNPCDISWGDNTQEQITTNTAGHTYTQPGTYTLQVLYQNVGFDEITIEVTPNTPPTFNLFTCGGNEVQVRVTDTNYDAYIINYNDGSPEVQVPKGNLAFDSHTFAFGGAKTISVRGKDVNADDNCNAANQNVQAIFTLPAPFINELVVTSNSQIDFEFTTLPNIQYRLEVATNNNTTFQLAQIVYNSITASLTNLRTDDNFYCFRLGAFDPCNNTTTYSNIICSANVDVEAQNNLNEITWISNNSGVSNFTLSRDGAIIGTLAPGTTGLTDNNVTCNNDYCYQLVTNYANSSTSISGIKCVTAFSSDLPTPITNATASVTSTGVQITWQQDPAFQAVEYSVFRREGSGSFQLIGNTLTQSYSDTEYNAETDYCYQISYVDACNNVSPLVNEICLIRLTGSLTPENHTNLTWTPYTGWENGVEEYIIEKYSEDGQLIQTIVVGPGASSYQDTEIIPDQQVIRYVVRAVPNDPGLSPAVSNEIVVIKESKIFYPTAFTPDNQGPVENEVFRVFGQYIGQFEMHIFNRWGEMLFSTNEIDVGWDGTFRGKEQPEGTYVFVARMTDLTGNSFTRSSSVVLLRKK
jgi:gliding motility-associated-like protein